MQFFTGTLAQLDAITHKPGNSFNRASAGTLRCNCDDCAALVAIRWEMRRELRQLQRAALPAVTYDA